MLDRRGTSLFTSAAQAVFNPLPVGIALATIVATLLVSPLVLIPGGIIWVGAVLATAAAKSRAQHEARLDITNLPPSLRHDLEGLNGALDDLRAAIASVPADHRILFVDIEREAREVRDAVVQMAGSAAALHRYLATNRAEDLQERLAALRQRLSETQDQAMRTELEAAIGDTEAQLERRERLITTLNRYRATLHGLQATAEELASRAVNLAVGGELAAQETFDETSSAHHIAELKASAAALEEVMRTNIEIE